MCYVCVRKFEMQYLSLSNNVLTKGKFIYAKLDHKREEFLCGGKRMRSGANLHVFHIKNASLDILISYSYEELLQMDAMVPGV